MFQLRPAVRVVLGILLGAVLGACATPRLPAPPKLIDQVSPPGFPRDVRFLSNDRDYLVTHLNRAVRSLSAATHGGPIRILALSGGGAGGAFGAAVAATRGVGDGDQGLAGGLVNMSRQVGAAIGVALWLLVSLAFRVYLHFFNSYSATDGSLGAVIILMLWLYLTGLAVLIGGEINAEIENVAAQSGAPDAKKKGRKRANR